MTKKDYQALARAIYEARREATADPKHDAERDVVVREVAEAIADVLQADSPRFDRARFIEACETGTCKGMKKENLALAIASGLNTGR